MVHRTAKLFFVSIPGLVYLPLMAVLFMANPSNRAFTCLLLVVWGAGILAITSFLAISFLGPKESTETIVYDDITVDMLPAEPWLQPEEQHLLIKAAAVTVIAGMVVVQLFKRWTTNG
jgi:hypothetical protein